MRNSSFFVRIFAPVVAAVYLAGVFGFDIHSSSEAHRTFIVPLFAGVSCEHIHPEAPCNSDIEEGECGTHEDCCHDVVEVCDAPCLTSTAGNPAPALLSFSICTETHPAPACDAVRQVLELLASVPPYRDLSLMCILRV